MTVRHLTPVRFSGNRRLLVILASIVGLMVGMAYAMHRCHFINYFVR